jgi:alpha-glucosidase
MSKSRFVTVGKVKSVYREKNAVEFVCQNGRVRVTALADNIIRVRATRAKKFGPDFSYAIAKTDRTDFAGRVTTHGGAVRVQTGKLAAWIPLESMRLEFRASNGRLLNSDAAPGMGWEAKKCRSYRALATDEMFFGCGERSGLLNHRGAKLTFWNTDDWNHTYLTDPLYVSIPFLISTRPGAHYGIFWDNSHRSQFNFQESDRYSLESDAGEIDYYFIAGDSVRDVVRGYTELTGKMWMPPRWALGFHQCRWSYMSAKEILDVAGQFRRRKIPCSAIYCDIDYMDRYRVFTWNPKTFPNPRQLVRRLGRQGIKLVAIVDPGVKNDDRCVVCRDGKKEDVFVKRPDGKVFTGKVWPGECVFPDFTNPRVREWWKQWHKALTDVGVAGIWNDMNEPAVWDKTTGGTMPLDNLHDYEGQGSTHARAHNVYGQCMAQAAHEALRELRPDERPFVITRAAYAGIQRYAMVWTGDNHSRWEQLAVSIPECLNLSLSGVPFCGADVGGFGSNCTGELLARWTQAGAFFPFFRNHSARGTRRQEPWAFGPEIEEICRRYIRLRYRLMPYLYNLFREAATDGTPIMRPLFWEFPDDPHGYAVDDQFLLGADILVAPVIKPAATQRPVWLPTGADWYNYWTKKKHTGGQHITAKAPLDTLPLFVRAGSIIPMAEPATLEVYPGRKTSGHLYEDDGASFAYERGEYSLTHFTWKSGKLRAERLATGYISAAKSYRVRVCCCSDNP